MKRLLFIIFYLLARDMLSLQSNLLRKWANPSGQYSSYVRIILTYFSDKSTLFSQGFNIKKKKYQSNATS